MAGASFRKTLLIGMGGSGHKVAVHFKGRLMEMYGCIPPSVQILSIDTTPAKETYELQTPGKPPIELDNAEFVSISVPDPIKAIEESKEIQTWWIKETPVSAISNGAGAVRIIGRLAAHLGFTLIQPKIEEKHRILSNPRLRSQMEQAGFELRDGMVVYLVGSIAGGSGAGMFLDLAYLCRDYFSADITVVGFFVLSEIFRNLAFTLRTPANCYASLMELEYYMGYKDLPREERIPGTETIHIGTKTLKADQPPLNVVHLIDGRTNLGAQVQSPGDLYAHIAECLAITCGAVGQGVADVEANIKGVIGSAGREIWSQRPARFSSVGYSALVYPADLYADIEQMRVTCELAESALQFLRDRKEEPEAAPTADAPVRDATKAFLDEEGLDEDNPQKLLDRIARFSERDFAIALPEGMDLSLPSAEQQVISYVGGQTRKLERDRAAKIDEGGQVLEGRLRECIQAVLEKASRQEERGQKPLGFRGRLAVGLDDIFTNLRKTLLAKRNSLLDDARDAEDFMHKSEDALRNLLGKKSGWFPFRGLQKQKHETGASHAAGTGKLLSMRMSIRLLERGASICEMAQGLLKREIGAWEEKSQSSQDFAALWKVVGDMAQAKQNEFLTRASRQSPVEILVGKEPLVEKETVVEEGTLVRKERRIYYYANSPKPEVDYAAFLKEAHVGSTRDLPRDVRKLAEIAFKWAAGKVKDLRTVSILDVLKTVEAEQPGYIKRRVRDAMELAMPLWRYQQAMVNGNPRGAEMCQIITAIGVHSPEKARALLDRGIRESIANRTIREPCYSQATNTSRIDFVNYEAVLPIFVLDGIDNLKKEYDKMLVPSTHVDKRLQFCLPYLVPDAAKKEERALTTLSLGIIPELGCIHDEKAPGKKRDFFLTDKPICEEGEKLYLKTPGGASTSFGEALEYLVDNPGILDALEKQVNARRAELEGERKGALREAVLRQVERLCRMLAKGGFSRQLTGQYLYREIHQLLKEIGDRRSVTECLASLE